MSTHGKRVAPAPAAALPRARGRGKKRGRGEAPAPEPALPRPRARGTKCARPPRKKIESGKAQWTAFTTGYRIEAGIWYTLHSKDGHPIHVPQDCCPFVPPTTRNQSSLYAIQSILALALKLCASTRTVYSKVIVSTVLHNNKQEDLSKSLKEKKDINSFDKAARLNLSYLFRAPTPEEVGAFNVAVKYGLPIKKIFDLGNFVPNKEELDAVADLVNSMWPESELDTDEKREAFVQNWPCVIDNIRVGYFLLFRMKSIIETVPGCADKRMAILTPPSVSAEAAAFLAQPSPQPSIGQTLQINGTYTFGRVMNELFKKLANFYSGVLSQSESVRNNCIRSVGANRTLIIEALRKKQGVKPEERAQMRLEEDKNAHAKDKVARYKELLETGTMKGFNWLSLYQDIRNAPKLQAQLRSRYPAFGAFVAALPNLLPQSLPATADAAKKFIRSFFSVKTAASFLAAYTDGMPDEGLDLLMGTFAEAYTNQLQADQLAADWPAFRDYLTMRNTLLPTVPPAQMPLLPDNSSLLLDQLMITYADIFLEAAETSSGSGPPAIE